MSIRPKNYIKLVLYGVALLLGSCLIINYFFTQERVEKTPEARKFDFMRTCKKIYPNTKNYCNELVKNYGKHLDD